MSYFILIFFFFFMDRSSADIMFLPSSVYKLWDLDLLADGPGRA